MPMAIVPSPFWRLPGPFDRLVGMRSIGRIMLVLIALILMSAFANCISCEESVHQLPAQKMDTQSAIFTVFPPEKSEALAVDPYANHNQWCEDIYRMECICADNSQTVCDPIDAETGESKACAPGRTGRPQICLRPAWARRQGINHHECTPQWLTRKQQKKEREKLRVIIDSVCEPPQWAQELSAWGTEHNMGSDPAKLCWHLKGADPNLPVCKRGHLCNPNKLFKFMTIPPRRETAWDNESAHELDLDKKANRRSYAHMRKYYEGNPHYSNPDRWGVGYGWYGHNAALHAQIWDTMAPPEILCRRVESTEVHLRKMRHSFKKLYKKYGDNEKRTYKLDNGDEVEVHGVTWYDLHRAASTGKMFPEEEIKTQRWSKKRKRMVKIGFVTRAKRVKLKPFETVMWEWLATPIPRETQNQIADEIRQDFAMSP